MTSDRGKNYAYWLSFFREAGILPAYEGKYASIFDDNRIKPDMLLDLTKECLKEMDIKAMGDIIAILRHAKLKHEQQCKAFGFDILKAAEPSTIIKLGNALASSVSSSTPLPLKSMASSSCVSTTTGNVEKQASNKLETIELPSVLDKSAKKSTSMEKSASPITQTTSASTTTTVKPLLDKKSSDRSTQKPMGPIAVKTSNKAETHNLSTTKETSAGDKLKAQKRIIIEHGESSSESDSSSKRSKLSSGDKKMNTSSDSSPGSTNKAQPSSSLRSVSVTQRLGPSVREAKSKSTEKGDVFSRLGGGDEQRVGKKHGAAELVEYDKRTTTVKNSKKESSEHPSVFNRLGEKDRQSSCKSLDSRRNESDHSRSSDRYREFPRSSGTSRDRERDRHYYTSRRQSSPSESRGRNPIHETSSREYRRYDSKASTIRRTFDTFDTERKEKTQGSRKDLKLEPGKSRPVAEVDEPKFTKSTKIVKSTIISHPVKDFQDGKVLRTTTERRGDGTTVVKRTVLKKIPKSMLKDRERSSPYSLPEIDDPLEKLIRD